MPERFPRAWLEELYSRAEIVRVVSAYTALRKNGRNYWGLCPFHHEKTPSFSVNPEHNLYYCFGCKAGGNVVQFVMEMEHIPFSEAVRQLAEKTGMTVPEMTYDPQAEERQRRSERIYSANREAAKYYHELLWSAQGKEALDYFHKRGLTDAVIRKFGLGASSTVRDGLYRHLMDQGYTEEEAIESGLCLKKETSVYDMFRGRAMFPIINLYGKVLGFGGRILEDGQPKYLNTADTMVFNKRLGVFAANFLRKTRTALKRILLVEGYMDVVSLMQYGIEGVVATLGTSLTAEQARFLKRFAPEVWIAYDGDDAGQHAIERALGIFEKEAVTTKVLFFPDNLDPDEFIRRMGVESFEKLRPLPEIEYRLMRTEQTLDMTTDDGRTAYAKAGASYLSKEKEPLDIERYAGFIAEKSGFSKEVILAQSGNALKSLNQTKPVKPAAAGFQPLQASPLYPEKALLSCLAMANLPEGTVTAEDFSPGPLKEFAQKLLSGEKPQQLMMDIEEPKSRQLISEALEISADTDPDKNLAAAQECLRMIRVERLQERISQLKKELQDPACSVENRSKHLNDIVGMNREIARLKNTANSKEASK